MENNFNDREIRKINELKKYYSDHEQEFESVLEGFKNLKGVSYWDYINIDSLLSLQKPLTSFPDEMIFIVYHQITELYFKLSSHELKNLIFGKNENGTPEYTESNNWMKRIGRIINYFDQLKYSFKTLMPGEKGSKNQFFDSEEFGQFRQSLAPASGFQTVSFRKLEILSTSIYNLISVDKRADFYNQTNVEEIYDHLYWRTGGQFFDEKTNEWKPTKTLKNFEAKYKQEIIEFAEKHKVYNLENLFFNYHPEDIDNHNKLEEIRKNQDIIDLLKEYDYFVNYDWKMHHFKSIEAHMPKESHGTGGTNWRKYLNPENQQISYFPKL